MTDWTMVKCAHGHRCKAAEEIIAEQLTRIAELESMMEIVGAALWHHGEHKIAISQAVIDAYRAARVVVPAFPSTVKP